MAAKNRVGLGNLKNPIDATRCYFGCQEIVHIGRVDFGRFEIIGNKCVCEWRGVADRSPIDDVEDEVRKGIQQTGLT